MKRGQQIYEGKAKKVFETENPALLIVSYKDDATAFNGLKKGTISGKSTINNRMTNHLMRYLEERGIPTHLVEELSERETIVRRVEIVPLETIVRNRAAGSFSKRFGVEEGLRFDRAVVEFTLKNDELGDPPINDDQAVALGISTPEEIARIKELALRVNALLRDFFKAREVELVDFKLEFGRLADGGIVLADEISPDTCRFWDVNTGEKLDKDRFRRDLGGVEEAYSEMFRRVIGEQA